MSAHTKKRPIKSPDVVFTVVGQDGVEYRVPKEKAEGFLVLLSDYRFEETVPADDVFRELDAKYTRPGVVLRGARAHSELTQAELAKALGIKQGDLSKMENGKRPIGKAMAKRLAKILNTGYKVFL